MSHEAQIRRSRRRSERHSGGGSGGGRADDCGLRGTESGSRKTRAQEVSSVRPLMAKRAPGSVITAAAGAALLRPTPYAHQLMAKLFYDRGQHFIAAAHLLRQK